MCVAEGWAAEVGVIAEVTRQAVLSGCVGGVRGRTGLGPCPDSPEHVWLAIHTRAYIHTHNTFHSKGI